MVILSRILRNVDWIIIITRATCCAHQYCNNDGYTQRCTILRVFEVRAYVRINA